MSTQPTLGELSQDFWRGKRVLVTGHTGFKGAWLTLVLQQLGALVTGVSLPPAGQPNLFTLLQLEPGMQSHYMDIRDAALVASVVRKAQPEVVLHLAAQPLVRAGYQAPVDTFSTNVMGTCHVLDCLRGLTSVRSVVVVTTDKVYLNNEHAYPYRECDPLGGHDPYSASKAASELVAACYRDAYFKSQGVALSTARAGNVIGGGDWSADRLIPDAVRAWQMNEPAAPLHIRRPHSIRPWQHVLEPITAYLVLAARQWWDPTLAASYNMGPLTHDAATVSDVIGLARQAYGRGEWVCTQPDGPHEAGCLALEIALVKERLGIVPRWSLTHAVTRTMQWYRALHDGALARDLCLKDWADFQRLGPGDS